MEQINYTSERYPSLYAINSEEFYKELREKVSDAIQTLKFEFISHVANDTLELAQYYCPVDTGKLKESLTLEMRSNGFFIYSNVEYSGYVHEILRYHHDTPTRAGFLIDAFQETMYKYMHELGIDNIPNFSVLLTAVPTLSLAFYPSKSGVFKIEDDLGLVDNKVSEEDKGVNWTDYFNPSLPKEDIDTKDSAISNITEFLHSKNPDLSFKVAFSDYKADLRLKNSTLKLNLSDSEIDLLAHTLALRERKGTYKENKFEEVNN